MKSSAAPKITNKKRDMMRNLYARALLYKFSPQKEQKELAQELKNLSEIVTYPSGLLEQTYKMLFDLVADWREVAKGTKPWAKKKYSDRVSQFHDVFSLMDAHKSRHFTNPQPTHIVYGSSQWQRDSMAGAHRMKDYDKFLISKHYIRSNETQIISALVHEQAHMLVLDYHMKQVFNMHDTGAAAEIAAAKIHKAKKEDPESGKAFKKLSYEEKLAMDIGYIEAALKTVPNEHFISTAQGYTVAVDVMQSDDKRFNWYKRSPEEAFVRMAEIYTALLFNQNADDAHCAIKGCLKASLHSKRYTQFMTAKQFARYTHEVDPKTSLTKLMTELNQ